MRILIALEPRSHRETLCDAIAQLRPQLDLVAIAFDELRARQVRLASAVVLLNRPVPVVQHRAFAWVVILPAPGASALVSIAGEEWVVEKLDLPGLLSLIDFSLTAFRIAGKQLPSPGADHSGGGMVAAMRSRFAVFAPWQYVHLLLVAMLLPLGISLACSCLNGTPTPWASGMLMLSLASIAALEVRQLWLLGGPPTGRRESPLPAVTGDANAADERM